MSSELIVQVVDFPEMIAVMTAAEVVNLLNLYSYMHSFLLNICMYIIIFWENDSNHGLDGLLVWIIMDY